MDRSNVITLISTSYEKDVYGVQQSVESRSDVFCKVESVSGTEFARTGQLNIKPEFVFVILGFEYNGETIVEFDGKRYSVYRTYQRSNDEMELYAERRTGTYGS